MVTLEFGSGGNKDHAHWPGNLTNFDLFTERQRTAIGEALVLALHQRTVHCSGYRITLVKIGLNYVNKTSI